MKQKYISLRLLEKKIDKTWKLTKDNFYVRFKDKIMKRRYSIPREYRIYVYLIGGKAKFFWVKLYFQIFVLFWYRYVWKMDQKHIFFWSWEEKGWSNLNLLTEDNFQVQSKEMTTKRRYLKSLEYRSCEYLLWIKNKKNYTNLYKKGSFHA